MELNKRKLYIEGFEENQTFSEVSSLCITYGHFTRIIRPVGKRYAFLFYETEKHAAEAKARFEECNVQCSYARHTNHRESSPDIDNKSNGKSTANGTEQISITPQVGEHILITHVDGIYLYGISAKQRKEYEAFMRTMADNGKQADPLLLPIKRHASALAMHNGTYARVIVTKAVDKADEYVPVYFCDIGINKEVSIEQLKVHYEWVNGRRWALRFQLRNAGHQDRAVPSVSKYLETFIGQEVQVASIYGNANSTTQIELIDPQSSGNINEIVNLLNNDLKIENLVSQYPVLGYDKFLYVIDATLMKDGDNLITFLQSKDKADFQTQQTQIDEFGQKVESFPSFDAQQDDLAIVKIDGKWYRCVLLEQVGDKAMVFLIDYYRSYFVDSCAIRKIARNIAFLPILTFPGKINGYAGDVSSLFAQFNNLVEQSEMIIVNVLDPPTENGCIYIVTF